MARLELDAHRALNTIRYRLEKGDYGVKVSHLYIATILERLFSDNRTRSHHWEICQPRR